MLPAAGMFCTMMVGLPGMCRPRWRADEPRLQVVAAADPRPEDEGDRLAGEELLGGRRWRQDGREYRRRQGGDKSWGEMRQGLFFSHAVDHPRITPRSGWRDASC